MTNIPLTFHERIVLWNLCGNHQVSNLKEASLYLRLMERLRATDDEMRETQFVTQEGHYRWHLPKENYGNRVVDLEDEEARALKTVMEAAPVRVNDAGWMLRIAEQLSQKETVPA